MLGSKQENLITNSLLVSINIPGEFMCLHIVCSMQPDNLSANRNNPKRYSGPSLILRVEGAGTPDYIPPCTVAAGCPLHCACCA